jgi:hypothetical protein
MEDFAELNLLSSTKKAKDDSNAKVYTSSLLEEFKQEDSVKQCHVMKSLVDTFTQITIPAETSVLPGKMHSSNMDID